MACIIILACSFPTSAGLFKKSRAQDTFLLPMANQISKSEGLRSAGWVGSEYHTHVINPGCHVTYVFLQHRSHALTGDPSDHALWVKRSMNRAHLRATGFKVT